MITDLLTNALNYINPRLLKYIEWLHIGMALKSEGYPIEAFISWSQKDPEKARITDFEGKWQSFQGNGITGATIMEIAKQQGFVPKRYEGDGCMSFNDTIEYDGVQEILSKPSEPSGAEQLVRYLKTIFNDSDIVGYVTTDAKYDEVKEKWLPTNGVCHRTARAIINDIYHYGDDLGASVGDIKPEAGGWIKFNALDGNGKRDKNVVSFKYALVECDDVDLFTQRLLYDDFKLPIATLTFSGLRSYHAVVKVDAENSREYKERVNFLYSYLKSKGIRLDENNKNPSRFTRMPGVLRNGVMQKLVATNIGCESWDEWIQFIASIENPLPPVKFFKDLNGWPALADELIEGVLRKGHKAIVTGGSKTAKTYSLLQLALCIANGLKWMDKLQCFKGKVLYIDFELSEASGWDRVHKIIDALGLDTDSLENLAIWSLKGQATTLDHLADKIIKKCKIGGFDVVILDPIYKVLFGDENSASDMGKFTNQLDKITAKAGVSVIYCHHHSKGAQGNKKSLDRGSGSGVFSRDADAIIDIIELETNQKFINENAENVTDRPFRIEITTREFLNPETFFVWFNYPLHKFDEKGVLAKLHAAGDVEPKSERKSADEKRAEEIASRYGEIASFYKVLVITRTQIMEYLHFSESTLKRAVNASKGQLKFEQNDEVVLTLKGGQEDE